MPYCSCFVAPLSRVERETEREKPALCCCGARGRGCHLSFVGSVSLGFLFVSCVVCCFYDSCFFCHWIVNLLLYETRVVNFCKERKAEVLPSLPARARLPARPPAASFQGRVCVACFVCVCPCVFPFLLGIGKNVNGMGCPSGTPPRRC